ncbi:MULTISPECIES: phage holin family protein [Enterobacterales]|uniref:phage holin family protein n=1 Tax=Enterobacterales TaxID=91347 RepID=UPI002EDA016C
MKYQILLYVAAFSFSLWGGGVSYVINRDDSEQGVRINGILSHLIVASFTGVVSGLICMDADLTALTVLSASSISSSIGLPLLRVFQAHILTVIASEKYPHT